VSVANIQIKTEGTRGTVILNGVDVSNQVTGCEIVAYAGEIPVVKLAFLADLDFEGDEGTAVGPLEPEQVITMTMGTDGRLQINGATEIKLTVGEPAVFVRRQ
jgi:hypothetical protein